MSQRHGLLDRLRDEWHHTAETLMRDSVSGNPADEWFAEEPTQVRPAPRIPHPRRPDHDLRRHPAVQGKHHHRHRFGHA